MRIELKIIDGEHSTPPVSNQLYHTSIGTLNLQCIFAVTMEGTLQLKVEPRPNAMLAEDGESHKLRGEYK